MAKSLGLEVVLHRRIDVSEMLITKHCVLAAVFFVAPYYKYVKSLSMINLSKASQTFVGARTQILCLHILRLLCNVN